MFSLSIFHLSILHHAVATYLYSIYYVQNDRFSLSFADFRHCHLTCLMKAVDSSSCLVQTAHVNSIGSIPISYFPPSPNPLPHLSHCSSSLALLFFLFLLIPPIKAEAESDSGRTDPGYADRPYSCILHQ